MLAQGRFGFGFYSWIPDSLYIPPGAHQSPAGFVLSILDCCTISASLLALPSLTMESLKTKALDWFSAAFHAEISALDPDSPLRMVKAIRVPSHGSQEFWS